MKYRIIVTNPFDKGMRRLMPRDRERARQLIEKIQAEPYTFKELSGNLRGLRSARFGNYRIVYTVDEKRKAIVLASIRPRERAYE